MAQYGDTDEDNTLSFDGADHSLDFSVDEKTESSVDLSMEIEEHHADESEPEPEVETEVHTVTEDAVEVAIEDEGEPEPEMADVDLKDEVLGILDLMTAGIPVNLEDELEIRIYDDEGLPKEEVSHLEKTTNRNTKDSNQKKSDYGKPNGLDFDNDEDRDAYIENLNKAVTELRLEAVAIGAMQMGFKHQIKLHEQMLKKHGDDNLEFVGMMKKIKSHRRYNDLSDVDYEEVEKRVLESVKDKLLVASPKNEVSVVRHKATKPNKKKFKINYIYLSAFFVGVLLLTGYFYKDAQSEVLNPNNNTEIVIGDNTPIICEGVDGELTINASTLMGYFEEEVFVFEAKIFKKLRKCTISREILK